MFNNLNLHRTTSNVLYRKFIYDYTEDFQLQWSQSKKIRRQIFQTVKDSTGTLSRRDFRVEDGLTS